MPTFAIYKMMFSKVSQRNMFAQDGRTVLDKAQEYLEEVLQEKLPIRKENQDKTVTILDNYVEARRDGVTLMVVCNEKKHRYKEKMDEKELEYHPGAYVVIDNREGVAQVAIERRRRRHMDAPLFRLPQASTCPRLLPPKGNAPRGAKRSTSSASETARKTKR